MVGIEELESITKSWVQDQPIPSLTVDGQEDAEPQPCPVALAGRKDQPFAWWDQGWCGDVGYRLLGHECGDLDTDAMRILEIVRKYPVRPYMVKGGGSGFDIPPGWGKYEWNWEIVKEFSRLWWSAAGDAVIARYGHRIPVVWRHLCERVPRETSIDV